jgi:glycosyltransferase involved in cell wall biosynthesis
MSAPRKILWANRYCLLDTSSGASLSARQMLVQLKRRGWDVRILGATVFDSERGMTLLNPHREALRGKPVVNVTDPDGLQHTLIVTRHWASDELRNAELNLLFTHYAALLDQFRPDLVFFYGGNAFDLLIPQEAKRRGIKSVAYLVNPNYVGGTRWCEDVDRILTDSHATAAFYKEKVGLDLVPLGTFIEPDKVVAPTPLRKHLLFVNPSLTKGAAIVAQLAWLMAQKRPDILFEVVESRGLWQPVLRSVTQALGDARDTLPNVIVTPTQADMRPVYARARILLAPSLWWESGARVLAEAMLNGIPAVVTDHGGSPEMIEEGGIKLKLDPELHQPPYQKVPRIELLAPLVERLIALYDDEALYRSYCERAAAVGRRKHDIERNTDRLIETLEDVLRQHGSTGAALDSSQGTS